MKPRILVAGGCHVVGYPIGEQYSFASVARDVLEAQDIHADWMYASPVLTKHANRLMNAVHSFQPDVLVLNIGNYEANMTFRKYFRRLLGPKGSEEGSSSEVLSFAPEFRYSLSFAWRLKCRLKLILDTLMGHQLVNMPLMRRQMGELLDAVAYSGPKHVIVMSLFPSLDPLYNRYREFLNPGFQRQCRERGFQYVDFMTRPGRGPGLYGDPAHFNRFGHEWLGQAVAEAALPMVRTISQAFNCTALDQAAYVTK